MTLTGTNIFTGGTTLCAGTLNINNSQALGTVAGTFIISGGTIDNSSGATLTTLNYPQTWSGDFTFKGTNDLNFGAGAIALGATRQVTITAGTLIEGGAISGTGFGITKVGVGILTLNGNSTYTGATTVTAGELRFSPAVNTTSNTQVVLNGGILGTTGITTNVSVTDASTLNLTANSSINLDPAIVHSVKFANSSAVVWTPGTQLTVNGWQGTAGFSGTAGKIFFGSSLGTLTSQQLSQITFTGFTSIPIILVGTGEIVPQGAAASLNVAGTLNNGSACIGVAAATQTYTITNTGPVDATGITVTSDNAQFVVSNISGTTALANNANTVTFQVTFTPTSAGPQSANITVFSAGSNSPIPVVTGTGLALPVSTFTYSSDPVNHPEFAGSFCQATITNPSPSANPSPTFTGGGVAGTFTSTPAGLVFVSTSTGQVNIRTSAVGNYTVTNTVTGANGCVTSATAQININALPTATITYAQPAFCTTDLNTEPVTLVPSTGLTGSYSSIPAGLTLNSSTGAITPSTSTPGNYKVIFNYFGGPNLCPNTDTAFVTIAQTASGTISYSGSPYCTNFGIANVANGLTGTTTGAQFSVLPLGLLIDQNTGAVTTLGSPSGSYTVSVTVPSLGGCSSYTTTAPIVITDTPTASFTYGGTLCTNAGTASPVITGPTGGTFTSTPAGLTISASTGVITLGTSTAGTYTVTYTTPATNGCISHVKTSVTVQASTATPVLGTTTICTNTTTLSITLSGESNGTPISVLANGSTVLSFTRTGTTANYTIPANTFHNGDVVTVTAQAAGKCLSLASNSVVVGTPPNPGTITGINSVCPNTTGIAYSVPAVAGVTYAWSYTPAAGVTITNGTTATPTLAFSGTAASGTLTVTASNTCGSGGSQSLPITVNAGAPTSGPGSITGLTTVCTGTSQTYSIAAVTGATNYTWTIPTGWTFNSGQGTTSINVTSGTPGQNGNITVTASNNCGNAPNPSSNAVSTANLNAGTGVDNTGNSGGTVTWTGPGNITAPGTPFATAATFGSVIPTSHYLIGSNYGFNIPANASIQGITVSINRQASAAGLTDLVVSLVKATNVLVGNNLASATAWPITPLTVATYGSTTNNWGANLTPADVNNIGFGVALSVTNPVAFTANTATVDVMQISVTYALPQSLPVTVSSGPTIALGANPVVLCNGATSVGLPYTGTTGSPDQYIITYDANANTAGLANVGITPLPSTPISLALPATLAAGTYNGTITVSSSTGCTGITSTPFTITVPSAITATPSETDNACFGGHTGTASVSPAGGNGSYTVSWTGPGGPAGTGTTISGLVAGTYNYSITDGNGCGPITGSVIVGQAPQITASTSETDASCNSNADGTATVFPSGGNGTYNISWTGPGFVGVRNTAQITGLIAGTYSYSITDGIGCGPLTGTVDVGQPDEIVATPVITSACSGGTGTIAINVSGGSGGEFFLSPLNGGPDITPNAPPVSIAAGDYQYFVIDGGCTIEVDFTVGQSAAILVADDGSKTDILCNGGTTGSITLGTVSGGTTPYAYTWTTSDGTIPAGQQNNANLTGLTAGTYNYSVTDANTCTAATGSFTINQPNAITVGLGSKTDVLCNAGTTGSITLGTVSGGTTPYAYTWTTSDGTIPAGQQNNANLTGLTAGTYNYSVTDANTCTPATGSFTINQPNAITVGLGSKTDVLCNAGTTGSITLGTVSGGTTPYAYTWTTSDGTIPAGQQNNANLTGLTAGTYNYSVTDANTCTPATGSFTINQPNAITVGLGSKTDVLCNAGTTGSITLGTVSGGTTPYAYTWTTSDGTIPAGQQNNANLTGLTAGTYNYSVTDANTCTPATGSFTINQPDAITVGLGSKTDISCNGGTTGSITLGTVSGGTTPYAYTWTTSDGTIPAGQQNNANLTGLTAGTYNL